MPRIDLSDSSSNHVYRLVRDLMAIGWKATQFPDAGKLKKNRQLFEIQLPTQTLRIRPSIYKVGDRGESHRLDERRIEITTTYSSGLLKDANWSDVVLGYDIDNEVYVGLDPRRLMLGGSTHNASSSVDPDALANAPRSTILVMPHATRSLGLEYQAIFRPSRLAEYLFNYRSIHEGRYDGLGQFSGRVVRRISRRIDLSPDKCFGSHIVFKVRAPSRVSSPRVSQEIVEAFERDDASSLSGITPEQLDAILRKCREVGDRGEYFVFEFERKRLQRASKHELAKKVKWISRERVNAGYDISSFEVDGSPRYIEVKSTIGTKLEFTMSKGEWNAAKKKGGAYWIYRVIETLKTPTISHKLCDPVDSNSKGLISISADGWIVKIND